jgi:hypothetical protein
VHGRERLVGERAADDTGGSDDHHRVAARQRLRDREHQRVALGEAVAGVDEGLGNGRHEHVPACRFYRIS